ncbi:ABC transporter ATP-binding protein [Streptoalloteichus hindustanus]|uniref:ABC-type quaternary amine transporter n=1 Tax=Streptoalloteichus hindustanus TaxID=2017 RepID=A0A1M5B5P4_STRHI|nr:ABC transporter ATP-binding protein [Streptoalloteichus hindustanus]SHF37760.1 2-aminoethylphosphonate transport system ATP-binding protein [Streptoalloteichus hindustanus]
MTAPAVELRGVSVHFGRTVALRELDLVVGRGEALALLGPSGSGKSTALKAVAGFVRPHSGRVLLSGVDVTDAPPHRRGLGVVVQNYALFPHMRVADNVAFGLRARRMPRREVEQRVTEVLAMVGMADYRRRYPRELSGGQQQRVAIARALAIRPPVLLLDEPLSALDAALREEMLAELLRLRRELPDTAMVYVTHDQGEALALADRVAVMRDARLVEVGPTAQLYHRPRAEFTASFLGAANLLPVELVAAAPEGSDGSDGTVRADGLATVRLAGAELRAEPTGPLPAGTPVALGVRPHRVEVRADAGLPARLLGVQWRGTGFRLELELDDGSRLRADVSTVDGLPAVGERVGVSIPDGCPLVPAGAGA